MASAETMRNIWRRFISAPRLEFARPRPRRWAPRSEGTHGAEHDPFQGERRRMIPSSARTGCSRGDWSGEGAGAPGSGRRPARRRPDGVKPGARRSFPAADTYSLAHGDLHRPVEILRRRGREVLHAIEASFHGHGILPEARDTQQGDLKPRRVPVFSQAVEVVGPGGP